ncbi:MAG: G-D-S-L family lipolytic protein [Symploca sp. SIO1B1]|nr:G-D-S-L family lipolytic protein [Symploca sp. SIO1A3]NER93719.1 G-D-S-L family lipolytic protein [Symploca sp. SIO1B1]
MQTLATPRVQSIHRPSLRLVVLGDSLIYGFGDPEGGGWVERLRRRWMSPDSPGHVIYNLGVRGDGVKQVQERLEQEFRSRGELKNRVPDAMILSVGVNDTARLGRPDGRNFNNFDTFQWELANLLDQAQGLCPVFFVGMVPVDESKMPFLNCLYYNHTDQYHYKEATRLACLRRQIPYLDIFDLWISRGQDWWSQNLSQDGLHPNVAGYQALLQDVLNWEVFNQLVL